MFKVFVTVTLCAGCLALQAAGCAKAPRERPVKLAPVDTGGGSLEATRRDLQGTWVLHSLTMMDSAGTEQPVKAKGSLVYDAYGNMSIVGQIEDPNVKNPIALEFTGRIVIDAARRQFYPADLESARPVDAKQVVPISPDKVRKYELAGDRFEVTYLDVSGKTTAVASWRRTAR